MKKFLVVVLSFLVFAACDKKQDKAAGPQPGQAAAQTEYAKLGTADYQKLLGENKGKVVLVNFFATWCPPCRKEVPELISMYNSYKDKGVVFIGVSVDESGAEAVKPFAEKVNFNYKVYLAAPELSASQQIDAIPHTFIFDKSGKTAQSVKGYAAPEDLSKMINALM